MNVKPKFKLGDLVCHIKTKLVGNVHYMELVGDRVKLYARCSEESDGCKGIVGYEYEFEEYKLSHIYGSSLINSVLTINIIEPEKVKQICVNYEYK